MFWESSIRQIAYNRVGVSEENSYIVVSVCLVLISVVLTGFQLYEPLAKWCGAGTSFQLLVLQILLHHQQLNIKKRDRFLELE